MSADFIKRKIFAFVGTLAAVGTVVGVYLYTRYLNNATVAAVSQNYYFLVSESTHIEASTHEITLNGGAGYLLEKDGREYVTISTYLTAQEAQTVQKTLTSETRIFSLGAEKLYFKTREEKQNAKRIIGAFQSLEDNVEVLDLEIQRLEKGGTQQSSKRILQTLKKQFVFLAKEYAKLLPSYANVCKTAAARITELLEDIIYVKDLRHLQCELCYAYTTLAEEFTI